MQVITTPTILTHYTIEIRFKDVSEGIWLISFFKYEDKEAAYLI